MCCTAGYAPRLAVTTQSAIRPTTQIPLAAILLPLRAPPDWYLAGRLNTRASIPPSPPSVLFSPHTNLCPLESDLIHLHFSVVSLSAVYRTGSSLWRRTACGTWWMPSRPSGPLRRCMTRCIRCLLKINALVIVSSPKLPSGRLTTIPSCPRSQLHGATDRDDPPTTCAASVLIKMAGSGWQAIHQPADNITAVVVRLQPPSLHGEQRPCVCTRLPAFLRRSSTLPLDDGQSAILCHVPSMYLR